MIQANCIRAATPMIHVPDVRAAAAWYAALGFVVLETVGGDDGVSFAILSAGETRLILNGGGRPSVESRREVDLYVTVDAVDELFASLTDEVEVIEPVHDTNYGMRELIIRDLTRFWVTLGRPLRIAAPLPPILP